VKASRADHGTKVDIIQTNHHTYNDENRIHEPDEFPNRLEALKKVVSFSVENPPVVFYSYKGYALF